MIKCKHQSQFQLGTYNNQTIKYRAKKIIALDSSPLLIFMQLNLPSYLSSYCRLSFYVLRKTCALETLSTQQRKQPFAWSCVLMFLLINSCWCVKETGKTSHPILLGWLSKYYYFLLKKIAYAQFFYDKTTRFLTVNLVPRNFPIVGPGCLPYIDDLTSHDERT